MNYEEMLAAAEDKQSYHLLDELPNEYNGKDTLATGRIKDKYPARDRFFPSAIKLRVETHCCIGLRQHTPTNGSL